MSTKDEIQIFDSTGDCFVMKVFREELGRQINILFDMGQGQEVVDQLIKSKEPIDGICVTHVDRDHIAGIIRLLENEEFMQSCQLKFIVFNQFNRAFISYEEGNELSRLIKKHDILLIESYRHCYSNINTALASQNISIHFFSKNKREKFHHMHHTSASTKYKIYITFLLPNEKHLEKLMREWDKYNRNCSGRTGEITNKSSIVCLVEFLNDAKSTTVLLTGDGFVSDIGKCFEKLGALKIDCIKLPHHASYISNVGIGQLIAKHGCTQAFYMKNSSITGEKETLQEVATHIPEKPIYCNGKFIIGGD